MLIEKSNGRLSLIKTKEQMLSSYRDNSPATKQIQLKNSIRMALSARIKVDDLEDENNRFCQCGGTFLKGNYNHREIIVCDKCFKVKYFQSKMGISLRRSLDYKCDNLKKNALNQVPTLKKIKIISTKIYKKPSIQKKGEDNSTLQNINFSPTISRRPNNDSAFNLNIISLKNSKTQNNKIDNINMNNHNKINSSNFSTLNNSDNKINNSNNSNINNRNNKNNTINVEEKSKKPKKRFLNSVPDFRTLLKNYCSQNIGNNKNEPEKEKKNLEEKEKEKENSFSDDLNVYAFKLIKLIGNGAYANIYLVQEIKTKKQYAFKKIIVDGEKEMEKVKNQIEIIKALNEFDDKSKKNIIEVYKYHLKKLDITSYCLYLLMPLAVTDWSKEIEDSSVTFPEEKLMKILTKLSRALSVMQYKNIAHRDIKPQNILIMENGDYKICDFDESIFVKKAYNFFEIKGTEMFMCPILRNCIFTGSKRAKINVYKSDIYSLGLCFVYAITRDFNILQDIKLCSDDKKNRQYIIDNSYYDKGYSDYFIDLIMKMIAYNEKDRLDCIQLYSLISNK